MSNFPYKNPISPLQSIGSQTIDRSKTFGNTFSVLNTGGFMEVFNLSDLVYTVPVGQTGSIEFSGNVIPIQFKKGTGSVFSPDVLTLNSDNISSGRRRLGMLVYVYETDKIYQFNIDNYLSLWSGATGATGPGGNTVVISDFGTTIKNNTAQGQNFINAWTASTIEGVDTGSNFTWSILNISSTGTSVTGNFLPLSGGTVSGNTIFQSGLSAATISATTYFNLPTDIYVTGATFSGNTLIISRNGNLSDINAPIQTITLSGVLSSVTFNIATTGTISATTFSGGSYYGDGSNLTNISNLYSVNGSLQSNRTVNLSGFTLNLSGVNTPNNLVLSSGNVGIGVLQPTNKLHISASTDPFRVVGLQSTVDPSVLTIDTSGVVHTIAISAITGTTSTITTGNFLPLSGGTVSGATRFLSGLTANTISATTYQNLPTDIRVTGSTYNNNTFTFTNNTGGTFSVLFNTLTGVTVNGVATITGNTNVGGSLTVTGNSALNGGISSTSFVGSTDRMVSSSSGGTLSASIDIITAYISSASTVATQLSTNSNWDINGNYTGSTINGTYQGQRYYDGNYFFEAVADNVFIRLIRG